MQLRQEVSRVKARGGGRGRLRHVGLGLRRCLWCPPLLMRVACKKCDDSSGQVKYDDGMASALDVAVNVAATFVFGLAYFGPLGGR